MDEFALIRRYFASLGHADGVVLGVGDDAAVLAVPPGEELVAATDTLVEGIHFPAGEPADAIAYRSIAVNVSDLAAMAARPRWLTLALTMPRIDAAWVAAFAKGLAEACAGNELALVGGDTTRGPLSITITMLGGVPAGQALTRGGARPGDNLYLTGTLGLAAAGLACLTGQTGLAADPTVTPEWADRLIDRFRRPPSRWRLALAHRARLAAAIDVSDGLLADAAHMGEASGVGIEIDNVGLLRVLPLPDGFDATTARELALTGGDDYELLCAARPEHDTVLAEAGFRCIGRCVAEPGLCVDGRRVAPAQRTGYRHFANG